MRLVIQIRRSAIVNRSDRHMYDLVNEVEAYPRRFAWCAGATVSGRTETELTARLELRIAGVRTQFITRNTLDPPRRIDLRLVEGQFRQLCGGWDFIALGDGCKVALQLDFDYSGKLLAPVVRTGFQKLADRMVDEFCREAERAYG